MKKILIILIVFTASAAVVNAQFEKGTFMMGVSSGLSLIGSGAGADLFTLGSTNIKEIEVYDGIDEYIYESKSSSFNLLPRAGYFFLDNFAGGAGVNLARSKSIEENDGTYEYTQTGFSFEPFLRYYLPLNSVTPFFEMNGSFGTINYKSELQGNDPVKSKASLSSFGGWIGVSLPIGMNASFDVMTGYSRYRTFQDSDFFTTEVKAGTIGINFGFRVFLGGYGSSADSSY